MIDFVGFMLKNQSYESQIYISTMGNIHNIYVKCIENITVLIYKCKNQIEFYDTN